jgi:putative addiction module killer protein
VIEVRHYVSRAGKDVFDDWLSELADARAQAKIAARINRLAAGNFGDCKPLRQGVCELRIDWGTRISGLLRDARQGLRIASLRGRQTKAVVGY